MLTEKQFHFLEKELGIMREELSCISKDKWIEIKLACFEIESSEAMTIAPDEAYLSEYGEIAASICDLKYEDVFSCQ